MIRFLGKEQFKAVGRRANLSFLATNEEFPSKAFAVTPVKAASMINTKLDGGAQLLSCDGSSSTVELKFAVVGGNSTEKCNQKGSAQLLAAAAFAGNKKNSGLRIVRFLESLGAQFTAVADREKIVYGINVLPDRVEPAIAAIISAISSPPHAPYVFEESRINALLNQDKQQSVSGFQIKELLMEAAFGEGSALGSPLFGNSLTKLCVDEVLAYRNAHFIQENLIIASSGIAHDRLKALVDLHIKRVPSGVAAKLPEYSFVGGDLKVRADLNGATHLAMAFPVDSGAKGNAHQVLLSALSASLAQKKVSAEAFSHTFSKGGILGIRTFGDAASATANLRAALTELKSMTAVTDFSAAKKKVSLEQLNSFQSNPTCHMIGAHLQNIDAVALADARKVTDKEVHDAVASLLKSKPAFVAYGATAGTASAQQLLA